MKIKELYSFTNDRQIWRIIPAGERLIIIEEREARSREVFFNCLELDNGDVIFRSYQPEEKFWIGIEAVHRDVIYFHKFAKPDMPGHKEIIAVDLMTLELLWSTSKYSFLFAYEDKIYCFINLFEGRKYFVLDYRTGEVLHELQDNEIDINELRYRSFENAFFNDSIFPEFCRGEDEASSLIEKASGSPLAGRPECINLDGYLYASYHVEESKGMLKNIFCIVEIDSGKVIFKEVLNDKTEKLIPENFFIKGDKLFLIKQKSVLQVFSIR